MGTFQQKNLYQLATIAIAFFVVNLSFNNCGGVGSMQSSTVSSQMDYDSRVSALKQVHAGNLPANFCVDSRNYGCLHKVFSSQADKDLIGPSEPVCTPLIDGTELCPQTKSFKYSTASAKENCKDNCSDTAINGFDAEEFECHVKLSLNTDGIYPLVAIESDFNTAVEKIYQSCLAIQKGTNE